MQAAWTEYLGVVTRTIPYTVDTATPLPTWQEHLGTIGTSIRPEFWQVALESAFCCFLAFVLGAIGFYGCSSRFRSWSFSDKGEAMERVPSTLHGLVSFVLAAMAVATDVDVLPLRLVNGVPNPYYVGSAYAMSMGYFAFDAILLLVFRMPQWEPVLLHHVLAIVGCMAMAGQPIQMALIGSLLFLTEFTNPFNNLDWYLEKYDLEWSLLGRITRGIMAVGWFLFRICPFVYIYHLLWMHRVELQTVNPVMLVIMWGNVGYLTLFNTYWFVAGPFRLYAKVVFLGHAPPAKQKAD